MITFFSLQLIADSEGGFMSALAKIEAADPDAFQSLGDRQQMDRGVGVLDALEGVRDVLVDRGW